MIGATTGYQDTRAVDEQRKSILVVEDEAVVRERAQEVLERFEKFFEQEKRWRKLIGK